jgi:hypothetical protein
VSGETSGNPPPYSTGEEPLSLNPTGEAERQDIFKSEQEKERELTNLSLAQDINERKRYARRSYKITRIWVWFLIAMSISQLATRIIFARGLETAEFIAVITTTTGSVFGFWWLVGRYLFPGPIRADAPVIIDPREPLPARRSRRAS